MPAPKCTIQGVIMPTPDGFNYFEVQQWLNDFLIAGDPGNRYKKRLAELESCKISSFEHRKSKENLEHEYLVFNLHDQYDDNRLLRVERSFFPPEGLENLATFRREVKTVKSTKGFGKPPPANDCVFISTSNTHAKIYGNDDWILSTFTFPPDRQPTVLDVAIVFFCISKVSEPYIGKTYMCYWYSDAIGRVLSCLFPGTYSVNRKNGWRAGHFHNLRMITEDGRFIYEGAGSAVTNILGRPLYDKLRGWMPKPKAAREPHSEPSPSSGADSPPDSSPEANSSSSEGDSTPSSEADILIFAEKTVRVEVDNDPKRGAAWDATPSESVNKMVASVVARKEEVAFDIQSRDAARITEVEHLQTAVVGLETKVTGLEDENAQIRAELEQLRAIDRH